MSKAIETYLDEFARRSIAPMCQKGKEQDAELLRIHVNNAERIVDGSETGIESFDAWVNQRGKARVIMTKHFGLLASFIGNTDGKALRAIHCYAADGMPNAVINIPGEVTA